ncbi:glycosyltransferase family 2 protein [Chitinophaga rhizosphaerae]|uniref:glycosyltransferase family 2 protein n=1 Tax=Chitinophaga rhizosphaerae TaxID=1864947 RepID=UPI000F815CA9|nr:galactosyltransferase-related protein [Chitinophaga rhizosphaerae]
MDPSYKITFCIICMNRLGHLQQTLQRNLADNPPNENVELLLLNYNSKDAMEPWVRENFQRELAGGHFVHFKTPDPAVFDHSHSKNLAFKLARGEIVCNINADVFMGPGLASHVLEAFARHPESFLHPQPGLRFGAGAAGIICVRKSDFLKVEGFDERMKIYGWEDVDFQNRLAHAGIQRLHITDERFCNAMDHPDKYDSRMLGARIHAVYLDRVLLAHVHRFTVLMLFSDGSYKLGQMINHAVRGGGIPVIPAGGPRPYFQYEIEGEAWQTGRWTHGPNGYRLIRAVPVEELPLLEKNTEMYILQEGNAETPFWRVRNRHVLDWLAYFEMDYKNRVLMLTNDRDKKTAINNGIFGQATVYRNFDPKMPVRVE